MEQGIKKQIVGILEKDCRLSAEEIAVMLGKETKEVELAIEERERGDFMRVSCPGKLG